MFNSNAIGCWFLLLSVKVPLNNINFSLTLLHELWSCDVRTTHYNEDYEPVAVQKSTHIHFVRKMLLQRQATGATRVKQARPGQQHALGCGASLCTCSE